MPRTAKFNYDYRKGSPWPYESLVPEFDFPILKTEEQLMEELERVDGGTVPYYRYSDEVVNSAAKSLQGLELGKYARLRPAIAAGMADVYSKGVISDAKEKLDRGYGELSGEVIYIQRNKRASEYPRSEVYKVSDARNQLLAEVSRSYPDVNLDSLFKRSGVYDLIIPNLVFDRTMTELSHAESAAYVSPTSGYVSAEQRIVSKGEIASPRKSPRSWTPTRRNTTRPSAMKGRGSSSCSGISSSPWPSWSSCTSASTSPTGKSSRNPTATSTC